jgi:citrate lyase subunit beta/citryl-CoA lyase
MSSRPSPALRSFRSKLFVPGARAELFDKALNSAADALSFDLEDAVLPEAKARARADVAAALTRAASMPRRPLVIVRVNAPGTPWFQDDLRAVMQPGLDWVNLPKAESVADVLYCAQKLGELEAAARAGRPARQHRKRGRPATRRQHRRGAPARGRPAAGPGRPL